MNKNIIENNVPMIFNFDAATSIRTIMKGDDVFFVVKDVCDALDLNRVADALKTLRENYELIKVDIKGVVLNHPLETSGGIQEMKIITETGLFDLIMQSRKPTALRFKHWISSEVLPSIRKTGTYSTDIPKSLPEALRAYANEVEMRELVTKQRDDAIKTKAWISDKKTATAMATASVRTRENEKLKEQIGDSKKYKQVKAIPWLSEVFNLKPTSVYSQIGKQLSKMSKQLGYKTKKIEDTKWGKVKAYHVSVIEHFKFKLNDDLNMMRNYRRKGTA